MERSAMPQHPFILASIDVWKQDKVLELRWADGTVSRLPFYGLRKNCPCVMCRGGHDMMDRFEPGLLRIATQQSSMPHLDLEQIDTVGRHALKIRWSDGHRDGMYRYELLRYFGDWIERQDVGSLAAEE